ncbi:MAG: hypothetical protein F4X40_00995, partial [Chloroflexi bacterium]|nr:hypothetical protein [Chloroflexota bacterium]
EQAVVNSIQTKLFDEIVEASEFTISPIIVEHEGRLVLERYVRQRQTMAGRAGQPLTADDISEEDLNNANEMAERDIKNALIVGQLVETENVDVSDEDVASEIERANESASSDEQKLEDNEQTRQSVKSYLQRQRTIEKVVKMARGLDDQTANETEES